MQTARKFIVHKIITILCFLYFLCVVVELKIGADGHNSLVRQTAGFRTYDHSYNQNAVVAVLRLHDVITLSMCAIIREIIRNSGVHGFAGNKEYDCLAKVLEDWTNSHASRKVN